MPEKYVDIVFTSFPAPSGCEFVEVEDRMGKAIRLGEWVDRGDGTFALRITEQAFNELD